MEKRILNIVLQHHTYKGSFPIFLISESEKMSTCFDLGTSTFHYEWKKMEQCTCCKAVLTIALATVATGIPDTNILASFSPNLVVFGLSRNPQES